MALRIQNCWRSKASRDAVKSKREDMEKMVLMQKGALRIQTQIRSFLARARDFAGLCSPMFSACRWSRECPW